MLDFSIIIPAYNEEKLLPNTLESLNCVVKDVDDYSGEIIVVDNNSTDNTAEIANEFGAIVVFEPHQQIARARNAGAHASNGRNLIFIDADTQIPLRLFNKTLDALESGEYCGGGALVSFDKVPRFYLTVAVWLWTALSKLFKWATGSYIYCLRDAFFDVGGFDEEYYIAEEIYLSIVLKKWGWKNGKKMTIINEKFTTSSRKVEWFTFKDIIGLALNLIINPKILKDKKACWLWYKRPGQ